MNKHFWFFEIELKCLYYNCNNKKLMDSLSTPKQSLCYRVGTDKDAFALWSSMITFTLTIRISGEYSNYT